MSNNSYESLNDRDESSGDDGVFTTRRKEKSSLRIRLNRVFSSGGGLRSPKSPSSLANSRGSSPGRNSPSAKSRYSWQASVGFPCRDNRSPQRSPKSATPTSKFSSAGSSSSPVSPPTPKTPQGAATWYDETKMKYSPQQQQKERKSESDSMNTPSGDLENQTTGISTKSNEARQSSSASSTTSRFSICRNGNLTGMFAWMRVFRLATMLHQIDC